jgi:hypothetical protein
MDPRLISSAGYILSAVIGVIVGCNLLYFIEKKLQNATKSIVFWIIISKFEFL